MPDNIEFARYLRKNMTESENKLWHKFLKYYPVKFRRQHPVDKYVLDFYCYKAKIAVELDGSQHYFDENIKKDNKRTEFLNENHGITVIRYTDYEVMKNFWDVCLDIHNNIQRNVNFEIVFPEGMDFSHLK